MKEKIIKNKEKKISKIGFSSLSKKFRVKIILHFFTVFIITLFSFYLMAVDNRIFGEKGGTPSVSHSCGSGCSHTHTNTFSGGNINDEYPNDSPSTTEMKDEKNYERFLPLWRYFNFRAIKKNQFVLIVLIFLLTYSFFEYFSSLLERRIAAKSYFLLRNILLKKFWNLDPEQKRESVYELRAILEKEIWTVSDLWEHLPAHLFQSLLTILSMILTRSSIGLDRINRDIFIFFLVLIVIFMFVYILLSDNLTRRYEDYREIATEDLIIVDKQISSAQLIENMGLTSFYEDLRNNQTKKTLLSEDRYAKSSSLLATLVSYLPNSYKYSGFFFINGSFPLQSFLRSLSTLSSAFYTLKDILDCFKEFGKYRFACSRIDNFLALGEREENLEKKSIVGLKIEEILLTNISFKYSSSQQLILDNYSRKFSKGFINRVTGDNGSGKTTILYLILGIIKPLSGEVLIKFSGSKIMNLHKDINLLEWREKIALYLSHDNLVENGSTGQKQLENISKNLDQRRDSQIFIFDESANALDLERQRFFMERIKNVINEDKIVILVHHKADLTDN